MSQNFNYIAPFSVSFAEFEFFQGYNVNDLSNRSIGFYSLLLTCNRPFTSDLHSGGTSILGVSNCNTANLFSNLRSIKFGTYMYLLTHLFACFWFLIGCPNDSSRSVMEDQRTSHLKYDSHGHLHHGNWEFEGNRSFECDINSWATQDGRDLGIHLSMSCDILNLLSLDLKSNFTVEALQKEC